jgi:single-stranded DNA-binding protein
MRGINKVMLAGNVGGRARYDKTSDGTPTCSFSVASDRHKDGAVVTAWVKVNAYGPGLVHTCERHLRKGTYVVVEGELMNRDTPEFRELVEVRAIELIFLERRG